MLRVHGRAELQAGDWRVRRDRLPLPVDVLMTPSVGAGPDRVAFLVMAHSEPMLLSRLVKRLQSPQTSVYVHVDRRTRLGPFKNALKKQGVSNVHWVRRVRSPWGTFGQVRASLSLLEHAMTQEKDATMFVL